MKKNITNKISALFLSIVIAVFILGISIALPVLIRDVYYVQIHYFKLVEKTGYSEETIRGAYEEMMDYCTKGGEAGGQRFGTGELAYTASAKAHFDDVERLFHLDFVLTGCTGAILLLLFILWLISRLADRRRTVLGKRGFFEAYIRPSRFLGRGPLFWGPVILLAVFGSAGIYAAMDYDGFFVFFHHLFFPGKENWLFDPATDEIIRILPDEVMQTFGMVILGILLFLSVLAITLDFVTGNDTNEHCT